MFVKFVIPDVRAWEREVLINPLAIQYVAICKANYDDTGNITEVLTCTLQLRENYKSFEVYGSLEGVLATLNKAMQ